MKHVLVVAGGHISGMICYLLSSRRCSKGVRSDPVRYHMPIPSEQLGANALSRLLQIDVRTLHAHVRAGTFPPATSVHPTSGRAQWSRGEIVELLRAQADEADATAALFDALQRLA